MIEKLGAPGYETISLPNPNAAAVIQALFAAGNNAPMVAEIGVGIGATTQVMATLLDNRGELHLYDFQDKVAELAADLANLGFANVKGFGNTDRHWDSDNWTLGRMLLDGKHEVYDYIYIDGAHTFAVRRAGLRAVRSAAEARRFPGIRRLRLVLCLLPAGCRIAANSS